MLNKTYLDLSIPNWRVPVHHVSGRPPSDWCILCLCAAAEGEGPEGPRRQRSNITTWDIISRRTCKKAKRAVRLKCEPGLMRRFHAWRCCKRLDGRLPRSPSHGEMSRMCCRSVAQNTCVGHCEAFPPRANSQKPMELM